MEAVESRVGPYVPVRLLGRGGMGEVWEAVDPALNRRVALKLLRCGDPDAAARFVREARVVAGLRHPNIAVLYATGVERGRLYFAMQLVDGAPLDRARPADAREAVRIVRDAARAAAFAHANGVIHRDLKPGNLMRAPDGTVFVLDFGLARPAAASMTVAGTVVGTPAYMPPEQARGEPVDARADVYALGATLYDFLAGEPPFRGRDVVEVLARVLDEPVRFPAGLDASLREVLARCLAKEADQRYATAAALADDLDRWLRVGTVSPPRRRRSRTWIAVPLVALVVAAALAARARLPAERTVASLDALVDRFGDSADRTAILAAIAEADRSQAPEVRLAIARARLAIGDLDGAERELDALLRRDPRSDDALRWRARVRLEECHRAPFGVVLAQAFPRRRSHAPEPWDRAVDDLRRAADGGDAVDRALRLGLVSGETERACALLQAEWRERGSRWAALWLARWTGESHWFDRAAAPGPCFATALHERGARRILGSEIDAGLADIQRALDLEPDHVGAMYSRAQFDHRIVFAATVMRSVLPMAADDVARAAALLDRIIEKRPGAAWPYVLRGIFRPAGPESGKRDFDRAIELDPGIAAAYVQRAALHIDAGDLDRALADIHRALKLEPENGTVHLLAGIVKGCRRELGEALPHFDKARALGAPLDEVRVHRGRVYAENGRYDEAIAALNPGVEHPVFGPVALFYRGRSHAFKRDFAAAIADFTKLIERRTSPKMAALALYWRAEARLQSDDPRGAIADFDAYLAEHGDEPYSLLNRAKARFILGERGAAAADLERALSAAPADWDRRGACEELLKRLR